MKKLLWILLLTAAVAVLPLPADNTTPPPCPYAESGHAYGDQDGDGHCDYTGLPVGECEGQSWGEGSEECPNPDCPGDCDGTPDRDRQRDGTGPGSGPGQGPHGRR